MFKYILKRILFFIPTLFFISLFTFGISKIASGDPVELRLAGGMSGSKGAGQKADKLAGEAQYIAMKKKLGLDIPAFYFSVSSQAIPKDFYKITRKKEKENLLALSEQYGNWNEIEAYYKALKGLETASFEIEKKDETYKSLKSFSASYNKLIYINDDTRILSFLDKIKNTINKEVSVKIDSVTNKTVTPLASMNNSFDALEKAYAAIKTNATPFKNWIPKFNWYGLKSQYHVWLFGNTSFMSEDDANVRHGFFSGDFGNSYLDGRPVKSIIWEAVGITMKMNIIAILLSTLIAIPLGVKLARSRGTKFDRITSILLFILYSLPSFWVATIFIVYITTPEYGMNWFPTYGLHSIDLPEDASFWTRFLDEAHHLVLPIITMLYGSFTYTARQMRGSMLGVMKQDYIRTATAKGLSEKVVTWKHTFRNSLIPIITMFAGILPSLIGGSFIIEIIFNINGMGRAALSATLARNYPVMYTVLMFSAILVMISMLLADLMYASVDPRISFTNKKG